MVMSVLADTSNLVILQNAQQLHLRSVRQLIS
jgi:hypothetical protein